MPSAVFTVTRDRAEIPATVQWRTVDDTAVAGRDYVAASGELTMEIGQKSAEISVEVLPHIVNTPSRTFHIEFFDQTAGVTLANESANCTLFTKEDLTGITWGQKQVRMFHPMYWTVDGQPTESCSIIADNTTFVATMISRTTHGLVGVIWDTVDTLDHEGIAYADHQETLHNAKLWFNIRITGNMPGFNHATLSPVLTLIDARDGDSYYVPLRQYATNISSDGKSATVKLDFTDLQMENGRYVDTRFISKMFLSLIPDGYTETNDVVAKDAEVFQITVQMLEPDTGWTMMDAGDFQAATHNIGICTAYDDMYNVSPLRIFHNLQRLGYDNGMIINHYIGMSHYYDFTVTSETVLPLAKSSRINSATTVWLKDFLFMAKEHGHDVMCSVSFELYSRSCPVEWVQHEWDDTLAATGYEIPSYVLSPSIDEGMNYLASIIDHIDDLCTEVGTKTIIQIGEPWWWYNTKTNNPCIYDYTTKTAFFEKTGMYAQNCGDMYEAEKLANVSPHKEYFAFVKDVLGARVAKFGKVLKEKNANAQITLLPFLPTILDHGIMEYVNIPENYYNTDNFDFFCSECYDWLLEGKLIKSRDAISYPRDTLGFPVNKILYLSGFVPDESLAPLHGFDLTTDYRRYLWKMIAGNIADNDKNYNGLRQYVWAYPQVMFDSITFVKAESLVIYGGKDAVQGYTKDTSL